MKGRVAIAKAAELSEQCDLPLLRLAQLAREEEAQIDAFVLGVLGEKRGAAVLRREKLKPKNEGLQGKTPEAGCVIM